MYLFYLTFPVLTLGAVLAWSGARMSFVWMHFVRGLLLSIPAVAVWLVLKPLSAPVWGSPLLVLTFLFRYWLVPYGLAFAVAPFMVRNRPAGHAGAELEDGGADSAGTATGGADHGSAGKFRMLAHLSGFMVLFALAQTLGLWNERNRVFALFLPVLLALSNVSISVLASRATHDGWPYALGPVLAMVGWSFASALAVTAFFMRMEWLGLLLASALGTGVVWMVRTRYMRA